MKVPSQILFGNLVSDDCLLVSLAYVYVQLLTSFQIHENFEETNAFYFEPSFKTFESLKSYNFPPVEHYLLFSFFVIFS